MHRTRQCQPLRENHCKINQEDESLEPSTDDGLVLYTIHSPSTSSFRNSVSAPTRRQRNLFDRDPEKLDNEDLPTDQSTMLGVSSRESGSSRRERFYERTNNYECSPSTPCPPELNQLVFHGDQQITAPACLVVISEIYLLAFVILPSVSVTENVM